MADAGNNRVQMYQLGRRVSGHVGVSRKVAHMVSQAHHERQTSPGSWDAPLRCADYWPSSSLSHCLTCAAVSSRCSARVRDAWSRPIGLPQSSRVPWKR